MSLPLQVVSRCDIALLQEVMDLEAVKSLLASLNRYRYSKIVHGLSPDVLVSLTVSAVTLWQHVVQILRASVAIVALQVIRDGIVFTWKVHKLTRVTTF